MKGTIRLGKELESKLRSREFARQSLSGPIIAPPSKPSVDDETLRKRLVKHLSKKYPAFAHRYERASLTELKYIVRLLRQSLENTFNSAPVMR